jgi:hypothetical protein
MGDTEIRVGLRKSIVGQMVRSFFAGGYLLHLKVCKNVLTEGSQYNLRHEKREGT